MADTNKRGSVSGKVATPKAAVTPSTPASSSASQATWDNMDALRSALGARYVQTISMFLCRAFASCVTIARWSESLIICLFHSVQVKTAQPDSKTLEGVLFTADPILNIVALNCAVPPPNPATSLSSQPGNYHIIPLKHILAFQILSPPPSKSGNDNDSDWTAGNTNAPPVASVDIKRLQDRADKAVQKLKDEEMKKGKGVSPIGQELFNVLDKMYDFLWLCAKSGTDIASQVLQPDTLGWRKHHPHGLGSHRSTLQLRGCQGPQGQTKHAAASQKGR